MSSSFEDILATATARGSNIVQGVVLSAIDGTGKSIYHKASGYNGLSSSAAPITEDATFWLASCTKLATSIAVLQCLERGLISLEEPVEKILPELADKQIVSLDGADVKLQLAKTKLTLRHLLTHTSGLSYEPMSAALMAWRKSTPRESDAIGTVTKLYNSPLVFEPGESWAYGPSIDWAGVLVERLNDGITLGEYLHKNIFHRLGSKGENTTFRLNSAAAKEAKIKERLLPNVRRQDDGTLIEHAFGFSQDSGTTIEHLVGFSQDVREDGGGAGWYSTVGDYMTILQDLIAPKPKLLKKENLEKWLFQGHITNTAALHQLTQIRTGMTPKSDDSVGPPDMNHTLGGLLFLQDSGVSPKGTLTWGGLPNVKWFANRERGLAAMFATQVTPTGDPPAQELAAKYFEEVWRLYNTS